MPWSHRRTHGTQNQRTPTVGPGFCDLWHRRLPPKSVHESSSTCFLWIRMKSASLLYSCPSLPRHWNLGLITGKGRKLKARTPKTHASLLLDYVSAGSELSEKRFSDWQRVGMQIRLAQHFQFMKLSLS